MPEYYVGLMSGTSMDGIDAVLVDFSNNKIPKLVCTHNHAWPNDVYQQLLASRQLADNQLYQLQTLDIRLGEIFADATLSLLDKSKLTTNDIIAIGNHGQTIRHRPNAAQPFSLQIGDAKTLAHKTSIHVISDFRTADIEAGGQGAPLAPAFHEAVFRSETENRGILNIGGIANLTVLPADQSKHITGFDTGPGNNLMDAWMAKCCGKSFDENGDFARSGKINEDLLDRCLNDTYFKTAPPKSTGFEQFNLDWLNEQIIKANKNLSDSDTQATLCELSARSITDAIKHNAAEITHLLVCGGGVHNAFLMERIQLALPKCKVGSSEVCGIHPDWVEAIAFAWLARQHTQNLAGNSPSVTGAKKAIVLGRMTTYE
ncbi:MAG: anhydro-N-acetylmuramic acid kinase [Gammaproteobacteria bacterium]|nr:anhydro-N-acetylmuramic acid kinase [Gammaproteobacteria bacterium]